MFFLMFVLVTFLRVLYKKNHHHVNRRSKLHSYSAEVPVLHTPVEVRFNTTCRFVHGQGKRGNVHIPAIMSVDFPDVVVLTVSFCCVVYSRGNRTPESEKKVDVGISHQTENEKEKCIRTRYVYIPFCCSTRSRCEL